MKSWAKYLLSGLVFLCLFVGAQAAEIPNTSVFSQTDANNNSGTVPTWAEAMAPSQVNDSARALQGAITREWNWGHPTVTSGGSANAQTLTYSVAPAAYYNGQRFCFEAGFSTTSSSTLNVNSLGAVAIKYLASGTLTDTAANTIRSGDRPCVTYRSTGPSFVLETVAAGISGPGSSTDNAIVRWDGTGGNAIQNSSPVVDDSGRIVMGNSSAIATFDASGSTPTLQVTGTSAVSSMGMSRFSADANPARVYFGKARGASVGTYTIVQSGDNLGEFEFDGADGTDLSVGARIAAKVDGTPGANNIPSRLSFSTASTANTNDVTERLRIDSGHNIYAYKDDGANPGQVRADHWIFLTSDNTLSNSGSAQPLFDGGGGPANGELTVDTGTYGIECNILVTSMSATSGNAGLSLAGTATLANIIQQWEGTDASSFSVPAASSWSASQTASSGINVVSGSAGTALSVTWRGQFDVTVAGTLIPTITLTTAAAAVVEQGSMCSFNRFGNTATATVGAWD